MPSATELIDLFNEAMARAAGSERLHFLEKASEGNPELMAQVLSLLQAQEGAGGFLNDPIVARPVLNCEAPGEMIGRYRLLERIGEGGCGVVYVAEQAEPVRRRVALKVIKLGMDTKQVVARFEAERQALAMMDHANIAKVLDAGSTETGRPYFVMELVRGVRITQFCEQNQLSTRERLELFIKVCQAIQHAHQKGVIHRDIKPSNVLVTLHDGVPVPKVIDFGIAKATEGRLTEATVYTQWLHFIGTPAYMSPEQAELSGTDIDTRADIYSLGVLLYELLTGQTPFDGERIMASGIDAMRKTIREEEPPRPSTQLTRGLLVAARERPGDSVALQRGTPPSLPRAQIQALIHQLKGDLDWIVMKCLEKDRARRYETANSLTADLNRHLHNEPVLARPPTALYRFQKMVRRNKLLVAAASAVLVALIVGLLIASWQAIRAIKAEGAARRNAYALEINAAFHALAENNLFQARALLDRQRPRGDAKDLPGFEWRHLWQLCRGDEAATFNDEGAQAVAFSPDGKLLAYSGHRIIVRDAVSHRPVATLPSGASTLSFAPHTNLLASGDDSVVKLWNTVTWKLERVLPGTVEPSLFSPDGQYLLTRAGGVFRLWDAQTWQPIGDCAGAPGFPWHARNIVAFSPDSQFLVTVAGKLQMGDFLRLWRLPGLENVADLHFDSNGDCRPGSVAFTPDGKHLVMGVKDGRLVVWDLATLLPVLTLKEHSAWVTAVAVAPDGNTIATASCDQTLNLWDANSFEHLVRLRGHVGEVLSLAWSPNSRILASGSNDGRTKLWHSDTRNPDLVLEGFGLVAGFIGAGTQLVTLASDRWCIWTPATGARKDLPIPTNPAMIVDGTPFAVMPDEPLGALGRIDGTIELWNLLTGAKVTAWLAHREGVSAIACSPDGKRLATGSTQGEVKIWSLLTHQEVARFGPLACQITCLAFSPEGQSLAASGICSTVWLWDLSIPGQQPRVLPGHQSLVASMAFSPPQGRLLATSSMVNEVRLWDPASSKGPVILHGHVDASAAVAFSPDGKTLATGGLDKKVKLWSVATEQELAAFSIAAAFPMVKFSPDGRMLALGDMIEDKPRIQILLAPTFEEIAAADAKREETKGPAP